jgi:hypothetical protein
MNGIVRNQRPYGFIDDIAPDQGFVPLDVGDDFRIYASGHFGNPLRSRPVVRGGHHDLSAEFPHGVGDPIIVRGHHGFAYQASGLRPFVDVLYHGLATDIDKGFARKSTGAVSGRNNSSYDHEGGPFSWALISL